MQKVSKILSIAIILSITALQAGVSVSGTVTSDNGEPLAYANVTVVGTNVGTASSEDGSYMLDLPSNFTTVIAVASFLPFMTSNRYIQLFLPVGILILTDPFLGFHSSMPVVYFCIFISQLFLLEILV